MCNIVTDFSKCECGAVTLYFESGDNNSLLEENLNKFNVDLDDAEELQKTYCCNHCVNHYGLDLCACGSGETPEDCEEDFDECGNPYENYGESVKFAPKLWT